MIDGENSPIETATLEVYEVYDKQTGNRVDDKLGVGIASSDGNESAVIVIDRPDWINLDRIGGDGSE